MSADVVTELEDRWVVNARRSVVRDIAASPSALRIESDSGLWIDVAGGWRAAVGSPVTGEEVDFDDVANLVGSQVLSVVLFSTGSIRIALSAGVTIVAKAADADRISAALPGHFTWEAREHAVSCWRAEAGDDG